MSTDKTDAERAAFEAAFDFPPVGISLLSAVAKDGAIDPKLQAYFYECGFAGWQAARLEAPAAQKPADLAVDRVVMPRGWNINRANVPPFQRIEIVAPNGYAAVVDSMARNPENLLYMLAETLLLADKPAQDAAIAQDAARYRLLRDKWDGGPPAWWNMEQLRDQGQNMDAAIDALLADKEPKT